MTQGLRSRRSPARSSIPVTPGAVMQPSRFERLRPTVPVLLGVGIFVLAFALYAGRMATSFTHGDSADYLISAHTGELEERGNGLPVYVTLLNLAVKMPLPFAVSDGIRANLRRWWRLWPSWSPV